MPLLDTQKLSKDLIDAISQGTTRLNEIYEDKVSGRNRREIRQMLDAADQANLDFGVGDAMRLMSMVPTMKNLSKFNKQLRSNTSSLEGSGFERHIAEGLAFLKTRYPKQYEAIKKIQTTGLRSGNAGEADVIKGGIRIEPRLNTTLSNVVDTGMHETTHINDYQRLNKRAQLRRLEERFPNTVNPDIMDPKVAASDERRLQNFLNQPKTHEEYLSRIEETKARQAGATAKSAYTNYIDLLKDDFGFTPDKATEFYDYLGNTVFRGR
jgi:hypothetical protein